MRQFWGKDLIRAILDILYQVVHTFYRVFWFMTMVQKNCTRMYSESNIFRGERACSDLYIYERIISW